MPETEVTATEAAATEARLLPRRPRLPAQLTSSLAGQVLGTMTARVGSLALTTALSIVVARVLGPGGRGEYAVAVATSALVAQLGNLGLHASNTYYLSRDRQLLSTLLGNSVAVCGIVGLVGAAALVSLRAAFPSAIPLHRATLVWVILSVPASIALLLAQNLMLALGRVGAYNRTDIAARVGSMALTGALVLSGLLSPTWMFAATVLATGGVAAWLLRSLARIGQGSQVRWSLLRSTWRFGARAYLAALASYVVLRIDVVLLGALATLKATGLYSVAVSLADLTVLLPTVVGTLLFPRLSSIADARARWLLAKRAVIGVGLVMLGICGLGAVFAAPAIKLVYGAPYAEASSAYLALLPGLAFLSVTILLNNFLAATGMPVITVITPLVAGAVNVGVNFILIPKAGIVGAGLASTIAYALMLVGPASYVALNPAVRGRTRVAA